MSAPSSITIELLDAIQDAFNRHDVDGILAHFADDCEWLMARGPAPRDGRRCHGKAEIRAVLAERYGRIPDMRWVDMRHWIIGDKALSEWVVQGTSVDGETLDYLGCDLWEFRDGKVVKKDTYWKYVE